MWCFVWSDNGLICSDNSLSSTDVLFGGPRVMSSHPEPPSCEDVRVFVNNFGAIIKSRECPLCELMRFVIFEANPHLPRNNGDLICAAGNCPPEPIDWSIIECYLVPFAADLVEKCQIYYPARKRGATVLWVHLIHPNDPKLFEYYIPDSGFAVSGCIPGRTCFLKLNFDETNIDILKQRPLLNGAKVLEDRPNFDKIKKWIHSCEEYHVVTCRRENSTYSSEALSAFRVVDVKDRRIVHVNFTGEAYAALSYVWGSNHEEHTSHLFDSGRVARPTQLPKTIEDALFVCEQIGVNYLWVDLLCINQKDARDKAVQIDNMGHIYANAVVTIVAATGADSNSGLAGVGGYAHSKRPAFRRQATRKVKSRNIITTLRSKVDSIVDKSRVWMNRGWTYQEGLLSRRCLVFSEDDVVFFCRNGYCRDSSNLGNRADGEFCKGIDFPQEHDCHKNIVLRNKQPWSTVYREFDYMNNVLELTQRHFTQESDVLNAFQGYLALIEKASEMEFSFGLPKSEILNGLCWLSMIPMELSLLPGFPSWSWAGWRKAPTMQRPGIRRIAAGRVRILYPFITYEVIDLSSEQWQLVDSRYMDLKCHSWVLSWVMGFEMDKTTTKNRVLQISAHVSFVRDDVLMINSKVASFRVGVMDPVSPCPFPRVCILTNDGRQIPPFCSDSGDAKMLKPSDPTYPSWNWAFDRPVRFVMLKYWQELHGHGSYQSFNRVLVMPLDNRAGTRHFRRTCALFLLPVDVWESAEPEMECIYLA
jgi:hypothetical protein